MVASKYYAVPLLKQKPTLMDPPATSVCADSQDFYKSQLIIGLLQAQFGGNMADCNHNDIVLRPPKKVEGANIPVAFYICKTCGLIVGVSEL